MKKTILRILCLLLLLALIAASNLADRQMERLDQQKAAADRLLQKQSYGEAILAYGQLLQKTPISFLGRDKAYVQAGTEGALRCADALLETLEGAQYLQDDGSIEKVLALATHPDVPDSFREDLAARTAQGTAMLEAEAERIRREEEEREAQRRQGLLNEGLEARAQGRLEEALDLVRSSGLQPELAEEIEAEILQKQDEALTAEVQEALEAQQFAEAEALAEQIHDETLREPLQARITAESDAYWAAKTREAIAALQFDEATTVAEQVADEALRETLKGEIEVGIIRVRDEGMAEEARAAIEALQFTEAAAIAEQVTDEALRETIKAEIELGIMREHDKGVVAEARAALEAMQPAQALALVEQVQEDSARKALRQEISDSWARIRTRLHETYRNTLWAGAWYTLVLGDGVHLTGDRRYEGLDAGLTEQDTVIGGAFGWMKLSQGKVELMGDTLGAHVIDNLIGADLSITK